MRILLLLTVPLFLFSNQDFISNYEYGAMLYANPRGISCAECHGKDGRGVLIGTFYTTDRKTKKRVVHEVRGADITKKTLNEIIVSINRVHDVMPTYSLTNEEVKAIYGYIYSKHK